MSAHVLTMRPKQALDHAEWLNGAERRAPEGRELSFDESMAALRAVTARIVAQFGLAECSAHRCRHGVNLERARCCQCHPFTASENIADVAPLISGPARPRQERLQGAK